MDTCLLWIKDYFQDLLISGLRATGVIFSGRTTRSLCWRQTLTNRGSKALAPKPFWVGNSGDAVGSGPLRPVDLPPDSLTDTSELGDSGCVVSREGRYATALVLDDSGVVRKQTPDKSDKRWEGGLPPYLCWKRFLDGNENLCNPVGDFAGVLNYETMVGHMSSYKPLRIVFMYLFLILSPVKMFVWETYFENQAQYSSTTHAHWETKKACNVFLSYITKFLLWAIESTPPYRYNKNKQLSK